VPDAELVVISEVGHLVHYETPDAAAAEIMRFLNRTRRTPEAIPEQNR
jgi:pimeloyl-ACP methyl ester carboxylesterase